ncbi:MAG: FliG C-terminal domain-containing protein, partial [Pseudomonadota bacterium]
LLEPHQAKAIADQLDEGAIERVISAYEDMRTVPKPVLLQIIAGFVTEVRCQNPRVRGGTRQAALLAEAIQPPPAKEGQEGEEKTAEANDQLGSIAPGADSAAIWAYFESMEPALVAKLIVNERASVIAAILHKLPDHQGGQIVTALPEEKAIAVISQMARGAPVSRKTLDAITESLRQQANQVDEDALDTDDDQNNFSHLTAILNRCPLSRQTAVLTPLRDIAAEETKEIEKGLIRFGTLSRILPRSAAPILFREMDETDLYTAIRFGAGQAQETVDFLYANISQRLAEQIREKIDAFPMPDEETGEDAQTKVMSQLLAWEKEGRYTFEEPKEDTEIENEPETDSTNEIADLSEED